MSFSGLLRVYRARIGIQLGHYVIEPLLHVGGGVVWLGCWRRVGIFGAVGFPA